MCNDFPHSWNELSIPQRSYAKSDPHPPPGAISCSSPFSALLQLHCPYSSENLPCLCPLWTLHTWLPAWRAQLCTEFCSADSCFPQALLTSSLVYATLTICTPLNHGHLHTLCSSTPRMCFECVCVLSHSSSLT